MFDIVLTLSCKIENLSFAVLAPGKSFHIIKLYETYSVEGS